MSVISVSLETQDLTATTDSSACTRVQVFVHVDTRRALTTVRGTVDGVVTTTHHRLTPGKMPRHILRAALTKTLLGAPVLGTSRLV